MKILGLITFSLFIFSGCAELITTPKNVVERTFASFKQASDGPIDYTEDIDLKVSCIEKNNFEYNIKFGYINNSNQIIEVPKSTKNKVITDHNSSLVQPDYTFLKGEERDFFVIKKVPIDKVVTWRLGSKSIVANSSFKTTCIDEFNQSADKFVGTQKSKKQVNLKWKTSNYKKLEKFKIDFSSDGINFVEIDKSPNRKISSEDRVNSRDVKVPVNGVWYFRLTHVYKNGEAELIKTIKVNVK